jgi:3-hydroxyacyl-CoA dehydrogenase / enoyl-CoA hydratase / 3-hydroxybutyryl-CoA epimerase
MAMSPTTSGAAWRYDCGADGLPTLWFDQRDRPQNVFDSAALEELDAHLAEVEQSGTVRGLLIRSAKPAGFCLGMDLETILSCRSATEVEAFVRRGQSVFDHLAALEIPTVAVIHGACLGAGLELALACRRRVALASAAILQIGTPEVEHGLVPAWGAIERLPRIMGPEDGLDLLISGRSIGYLLARSHHVVDRLAADLDAPSVLELIGRAPVTETTWPEAAWETGWERAKERIDEQPGDFPEAKLQILELSAIHVTRGRAAAIEATARALGELAMTESVRASLAELLAVGSKRPVA